MKIVRGQSSPADVARIKTQCAELVAKYPGKNCEECGIFVPNCTCGEQGCADAGHREECAGAKK